MGRLVVVEGSIGLVLGLVGVGSIGLVGRVVVVVVLGRRDRSSLGLGGGVSWHKVGEGGEGRDLGARVGGRLVGPGVGVSRGFWKG